MRGEAAHDEFVEKSYEDTIALAKLLDFDALYLPWRLPARPARQLPAWPRQRKLHWPRHNMPAISKITR